MKIRKKRMMLLLMLLACYIAVFAGEPNYIQTTNRINICPAGQSYTYDEIVVRNYEDGLGRLIQIQRLLNGATKKLVLGTEFDNFGRKEKVFLPFVEPGSIEYITVDQLEDKAKAFRPDADGYPFKHTIFWNDIFSRIRKTGSSGLLFSLNENEADPANGGHPSKAWYFGTKDNSGNTHLTDKGFLKSTSLIVTNLDTWQEQGIIPELIEPNMYLRVYQDPNGAFLQIITDIFENELRTSDPDGNVLAEYRKNVLGYCLVETPPQSVINPVNASNYYYNTLGQLLNKEIPDEGGIKFKYNSSGLLRFMQDANQRYRWENDDGKPFFVFEYNKIGRQITTAVLDHPDLPVTTFDELDGDMPIDEYIDDDHCIIKNRNIYDNLKGKESYFNHSALKGIDISLLRNTKGKIVAAISYGENYSPTTNPEDKIINAFSYDEKGRLKTKYINIPDYLKIPGSPLQSITYFYRLSGELYEKHYNNGEEIIKTIYKYDNSGRLVEICNENDKKIISWQYNDINQIKTKSFWDEHDGSLNNFDVSYNYNIRNWIKSIVYNEGTTKFKEFMYYAKPPQVNPDELYPEEKRQYNGNVGRITVEQSTTQFNSLELNYTYDKFNRLIEVRNGNDVTNKNDFFDGDYEYDRIGRMLIKNEGYESDGTPIAPRDGYKYQPGKNRLRYIENSDKPKTLNDNDNYIYDENGNMVLDRSKKMTVVYDWRNMPVIFKFYDIIPDQNIEWYETAKLEIKDGVNLLAYVEMMYDAKGKRVSKKLYKVEE